MRRINWLNVEWYELCGELEVSAGADREVP